MFAGCSEFYDRRTVAKTVSAVTFPQLADWNPIEQGGQGVGDVLTDGNNNGREVVGSTSQPSIYFYSDGTNFFVRLRLDDDPQKITGSSTTVQPFGWGVVFDTDGNLNDYEYSFFVDGTGSSARIVFGKNTSQATLGNPSDSIEIELYAQSISFSEPGKNIDVVLADSNFGDPVGDPDYFLDFTMPIANMEDGGNGIDPTTTLRVIAGTSNSGNALTLDFAGYDDSSGTPTITDLASDETTLSGDPPAGCGNAILETGEGCDHGGTPGPACDASCLIPNGTACNDVSPGFLGNDSCASGVCDTTGNPMPGVCEAAGACGNGVLEAGEGCDDGNIANGDGCNGTCAIEDGTQCNTLAPGNIGDGSCASGVCDVVGNGSPGICEAANACGNGVLEIGEGCDDGGTVGNDGCDSNCAVEIGFACNNSPPGNVGDSSCASSVCDVVGNVAPGVCEAVSTCGNGLLEAGEGCDDGGTVSGDGCDSICKIENGSSCNETPPGDVGDASCGSGACDVSGGAPGTCVAASGCGNGTLEPGEGCDHGGAPGATCNASCLIPVGAACNDLSPGRVGDSSCATGICDTTGNVAPGICEGTDICGNGVIEVGEGCDDGGTANGDGCSSSCFLEDGATCNAMAPGNTGNTSCASGVCDVVGNIFPGVCEPSGVCGNGHLEVGEGCDDGGIVAGDGCSAGCLVESGSTCNAASPGVMGDASCVSGLCDTTGNPLPGICEAAGVCGNGKLESSEGCDDGGTGNGDGCNAVCAIETGFDCNSTAPGDTGDSSCASGVCDSVGNVAPGICEDAGVCGNGILETNEGCDDGGVSNGDGCNSTCLVELGSACNELVPGNIGNPSCANGVCDTLGNPTPGICEAFGVCGNGALENGEGCDDGNVANGDGCDGTCLVENGNACNSSPLGTIGSASCASGICDIIGNVSGICEPVGTCGNGVLEANEGCDDGSVVNGDGCNSLCLIENEQACNTTSPGAVLDFSCASGICDGVGNSFPGVCEPIGTCGNSIRELGEECDDGGVVGGDGCSAVCTRDNDLDGVPDSVDIDDDNDGILDTVEGSGTIDTDGDGIADHFDLDSDNDGILDVVEADHDGIDADRDGMVDGPVGLNGFVDELETFPDSDVVDYNSDGLGSDVPANSDADAVPDFQDLDADNDSISDLVEAGYAAGDIDMDNNGVVDSSDDADGDGIQDSVDGDLDNYGDDDSGFVLPDADGAGGADYRDVDSDGDGFNDIDGAGNSRFDLDLNGQVDPQGDADNDGIDDVVDDSDGDGIPDADDSDLPVFGGLSIPDADGDGIANAVDLDDDNDGIADATEGTGDTDQDGVLDVFDLDSDGDGILDVIEADHDESDVNMDGRVDCVVGVGANGLCDSLEVIPDTGIVDYDSDGMGPDLPANSDGDTQFDFQDLDADNDGINDVIEAGGIDQDGNGIHDSSGDTTSDVDGDGVVDAIDIDEGGQAITPPDTDEDGVENYLDLDSDNDAIPDITEGGSGAVDADLDGVVDGEDIDADGIPDNTDGFSGFGDSDSPAVPDGDSDTDPDSPDYIDIDSNGDGTADINSTDHAALDQNGDGTLDDDTDLDRDGIADVVDSDVKLFGGLGSVDTDGTDGEPFVDEQVYIAGGGCSAIPSNDDASGTLGVLLLLIFACLRRKLLKKAKCTGLLALGAVLMLAPTPGWSQAVTEKFSLERFRLSLDRTGILDVESGEIPRHLFWDVSVWFGHSDDPLVVYSEQDGNRTGSLVSDRLSANLLVALGLYEYVQIGVDIPIVLSQNADQVPNVVQDSLASLGMGDVRLMAKLRLLSQKRHGMSLAIIPVITVPSARAKDYRGEEGVSFQPEIAVSRTWAKVFRSAINVGYRLRKNADLRGLRVDDELFLRVGVAYRFVPSLELGWTYNMATSGTDPFSDSNENHMESDAGISFLAAQNLDLFVGGGIGLHEGYGTPDWRVFAGFRLRRKHEPTPVPVVKTQVPEVKKAPVDKDGDGLLGEQDRCPTDAEDLDGFEDGDGCPEPDNDRDGVLDAEDACVNVPGLVARKGCPLVDSDGDSVLDEKDLCPKEPGVVAFEGCPKKQLVTLTEDKIEILERIYFRTNKAIILSRSFPVLENVANVLKGHQEIRKIMVEGHTDDRGSARYNKDLSQRRADAVVAFLVRAGVAAERLESVGHGEERPITSNRSKSGRAKNRRVEFRILGHVKGAIEQRDSGPTSETID